MCSDEYIALSNYRTEMRDLPVVAGDARYRDAGQPAVLREG